MSFDFASVAAPFRMHPGLRRLAAGWPEVMKALDEIGYEGYGIAEVPGGDAARMKFLSERIEQLYAG